MAAADGPDGALPVAMPVVGSRLVTVEHRAWNLLGNAIGPVRTTALRITVTLGAGCRVERVDGRPLGDLAERCRDQIAAARGELEERLRRGGPRATPPGLQPVPQPTQPAPSLSSGDKRTTSSVFRCERQVITDRITRLRQEAPVAAAQAAAIQAEENADRERRAEQQAARERLAAIRAQYWANQQQEQADEFLPSPASDAGDSAPARQHTSSVFRVDRDAITDRIGRLRRRPEGDPEVVEQPSPSDVRK